MRKLFTLFLLTTSIACFGQNKNFLKEVSSITFYGVNYSAAKVFGATETPEQFKVAFTGINQLFITETKKYNVSKQLKIKVDEISLYAVNQVNANIDPEQLITTDGSYTLSEEEIKHALEALPIQQKPGIGLVFIAKLLDKAEYYGYYQVVFFNTETKEIIEDWPTGGSARGFGLRNFWAHSIYKAINNL